MATFLSSTLAASVVIGCFCDFIHSVFSLSIVRVLSFSDINDVDISSFVEEYAVVVGQFPVCLKLVLVEATLKIVIPHFVLISHRKPIFNLLVLNLEVDALLDVMSAC